jgi:hypothetical protein
MLMHSGRKFQLANNALHGSIIEVSISPEPASARTQLE